MLKAIKIIGVMVLLVSICSSVAIYAEEPQQSRQPSEVNKKDPLTEMSLGDLIPLATALSRRKETLEKETAILPDTARVEKRFSAVAETVENYELLLYRQRFIGYFRHGKLVRIKFVLLSERYYLERTIEPVLDKIQQLETSKKIWLSDQKFWQEQNALHDGRDESKEVLSTIAKALTTIENALEIIRTRLEPWLAHHERSGEIQATIGRLLTDLEVQILIKRRNILAASFPSIFHAEFYTQFDRELLDQALRGFRQLSWFRGEFFERNGWFIALQVFITLFLIYYILKNRRDFEETEQRCFFSKRPFSAGLFIGIGPFYMVNQTGPPLWILTLSVMAGISFARLVAPLTVNSWEKRFFYGIILLYIAMLFFYEVDLPQPLSRLFVLVSALIGFLLCIKLYPEKTGRTNEALFAWAIRLTMVVFIVVMVTELGGKALLAEFLLSVIIRIIAIVIAFFLLKKLAKAVLEVIIHAALFQRVSLVRNHTDAIIRRVGLITDGFIFILALSTVLVIFWIYDNRLEAAKAFISLSFTVGSWQISLELIIGAMALLYGALLTSWIIQSVIMESTLGPYKFESGFRYSVARLVHYAIVFVAFLLALSLLGFEMTKLTIMLSALGVGVGFGLQSVVSNFACGIIMLFERPVRVGDYIEFNNENAQIKTIGLRASKVRRLDKAEIIIPNSTLLGNPITNWTLTDRILRLSFPIGVTYGSDVSLVRETLLGCARDQDWVLKTPEPRAYFKKFGENALLFELHVYIANYAGRFQIESDLNQEIDRRFRMAEIEIAFPQRDLHLRSVDPSIDSGRLKPED